MGRKVNQVGAQRPDDQAPDGEQMPPAGGAAGIEISNATPVGIVPGMPIATVVRPETRAEIPPPKRYRVTRGTGSQGILWNGATVHIKTGKEFAEGVYDVQFLKDRGVYCEELK